MEMIRFLASSLVIILALCSHGTDGNDVRVPRVYGKIVKIQPQSRNTGFQCREEGFHADPETCHLFYRCLETSNGKFITFRFQCGPGLVFDPETSVCNYQSSAKRLDCKDTAHPQREHKYHEPSTSQRSNTDSNELDGQPPPSPISTEKPEPTNTNKPTPSTSQTSPTSENDDSTTNDVCTKDGFIGDSRDCKKFYRCVANGRGGYLKYEFMCSQSTVWDQSIQGCNHPWAVENKECGTKEPDSLKEPAQENPSQTNNEIDENEEEDSKYPGSQSQVSSTHSPVVQDEEIAETTPRTTVSSTSSSSTHALEETTNEIENNGEICKSSGFYGDKKDCKKFYRCVENGRGSYSKYEFSCGEGTVWDSQAEACNHAWAVKNCGGNGTEEYNKVEQTTAKQESTTSAPTTNQIVTTEESESDSGYGQQAAPTTQKASTAENHKGGSDNVCSTSGFTGDPNDCKIFYRCVDNGKGSFTKYEFSCGEGTVWDPDTQACNHEWAVKKCGGKSTEEYNKVEHTTLKHEITTSSSTTSHISATEETEEDSGYGQQTSPTSTEKTSTTQKEKGESDSICTNNGFIGDPKDCKIFYRCVDNGKGSYTKYEFSCGEGTVWDPETEACNHAWAVKKCGGKSTEEYNEMVQATTSKIKPTTQMSSTLQDDNEGYATSEKTDETESTTQAKEKPNRENICQSNGFVGDPNDCKKFYRCVDNGHGGFTRYEFSCGEGTLWDPDLEACNHAWAVKECGHKPTQNHSVEQTTAGTTSTEEVSNGYESSTSTTTTSNSPAQSTEKCSSEGFYGDKNDCRKFYRCVDNGKGSFTRYEFYCGEGTVWDQEIQGCNHEISGKGCKSGVQSSTSLKPDISTDTHTTNKVDETQTMITATSIDSYESTVSPSRGVCSSEGFFGDQNDCKKFYRCVDNGKGGYTKYDFVCGEGTVWDQEIQGCNHATDSKDCISQQQSSSIPPEQISSSEETTSTTTQTSTTERQSDEYDNSSSNKPNQDGECTSEGYYANANDCKKFYRCVDNGKGGYTKYDFTCGDGTAWDNDLQTCNHENEVEACKNQGTNENMNDPEIGETTQSTEATTKKHQTSAPDSSTMQSTTSGQQQSTKDDKCEGEGYFANSQDCKKFYRCVDNGKGGYTKYDFDCGEGTVWDQELQTCNHPSDENSKNCISNGSQSSNQNTNENSATESTQSSSSTTSSGSDCSSNNTDSGTKKPNKSNVSCPKAGFYANPNDCKKFYRCVDWDGDGKKFSVFHFDCGEGTIWDPAVETCNYEDSVYPPRDCGSSQSASVDESSTTTTSETSTTEEQTTTEKTTTQKSTTTTEKTTTKKQDSTTQKTTTKQETTSQKQTTQQQTTEAQTTQEQTTQAQTTQQQTTQEQTTQQQTTQEQTTQKQTTQAQTTQEQTTQEQTTQEQTTQEQTTQEQTTQEQTTQEQTTQEQTTQEQTTQQQTTQEQTTQEQTTQEQTTQDQTTQESTTESSTTEESTSETTTESSSNEKECPETDDDQYLYVCPTGFRRHPKYCNLFYQCSEDDDNHEVKIATFTCPNNTIYDEKKTQCVEEEKAEKKCNGQKADKRRFKRVDVDSEAPIPVGNQRLGCTAPGHYPIDKLDECSPAFIKCEKVKNSSKLRSYMYKCPNEYVYWPISRRCEKASKIKSCANLQRSEWIRSIRVPTEHENVANN